MSEKGKAHIDDVSTLKHLGSQETEYIYDGPDARMLETFPNRKEGRDYVVELVFPEFTSLCPKTGQPDFAKITIRYTPDKLCVESKSIKLYFFAYRNFGAFMESITNKILDDFVQVCDPKWMQVVGEFNARGGLVINVDTQYPK